jgi:hypothetical protein
MIIFLRTFLRNTPYSDKLERIYKLYGYSQADRPTQQAH